MLLRLYACSFSLALGLLSGCTTTDSESGGDGTYDGTADSMDSLPDCGPDSQGSSFWVKEKGAFDCTASGQWKQRKNAKKPDDLDEETVGVTPRIVK